MAYTHPPRDGALAISDVGIGFQHPPGFTIDRPTGYPETLFVYFLVPVKLRMPDETTRAEAHSCVINTAGSPHWYQGDGVGLENHWFHCAGTYFDQLLQQYDIPVNRVLRPQQTDFIPAILLELRQELNRQDAFAARQIELLLERLCLCLSRALHDRQHAAMTPRQRELRDAFQQLRDAIYHQPQQPWTVIQMAQRMHLSASRFSPLYRAFFGVSPYEDVLHARLERAKWLLTSTTETITAIAEQSGFDSIYHFSRAFRRKIGCAPLHYAHRTTSSR
ncbi:MAG TPA: AraC family transcriptional regulator [Armatimonadota bacterium]|jgi:AraC-like DNA-binding protein